MNDRAGSVSLRHCVCTGSGAYWSDVQSVSRTVAEAWSCSAHVHVGMGLKMGVATCLTEQRQSLASKTHPRYRLLPEVMANYLGSRKVICINTLNPELNPICYLLALLGAHHFLHVSRIRVKLLTLRRLMSYIYGAPILDVSRSHTTTQHSR